jgi:hypothetical protein
MGFGVEPGWMTWRDITAGDVPLSVRTTARTDFRILGRALVGRAVPSPPHRGEDTASTRDPGNYFWQPI